MPSPQWMHLVALPIAVVFAAAVQGQPHLVKDINVSQDPYASSDPREFVTIGNVTFFSALTADHGRQLWKTDTTEAGTVVVKVIGSAQEDPNPHNLTNAGGTLFFIARQSDAEALWKSDGTAAGTVQIANVYPGLASGQELMAVAGGVLFVGDDETGPELWRTDGTTSGTAPVKDMNPGPAGSHPSNLTNVEGSIFLFADDGIHGRQLWRSDGTTAGTALVKDIQPGPSVCLNPLALGPEVAAIDGTFFFAAAEGTRGCELWKSDGTAIGTVVVGEEVAGATPQSPSWLTTVNHTLFFAATSDARGAELWKSDGTASGTRRVSEITPGMAGNSLSELTDVNGTLFFSAFQCGSGAELWKSDGSASGTIRVKEINPGPGSADPTDLTVVGGTLFFAATDVPNEGGDCTGPSDVYSPQKELWKSDGTEDGTGKIREIVPGSEGSHPAALANANGVLLFSANDGRVGQELWKSGGTENDTVLLKDINVVPGSSRPGNLTDVNGTLFFTADDGSVGRQLWKSDGTEAGTQLLKVIVPEPRSLDPTYWQQPRMTNVDGRLFFIADDGTHGLELWTSDGTSSGTALVKDINPGPDISFSPFTADLANVGGVLYFGANDGTHGSELWKSDGTETGTRLVRDILPGPDGSGPERLVGVATNAFFVAFDGTSRDLWKSDGSETGTVRVMKGNGAGLSQLTDVAGTLFFAATNPGRAGDLWRSDGTEPGTQRLSSGISPSDLKAAGDTLFFSADTPGYGEELWKSDGTSAGTVRVKDINPGAPSSGPDRFTDIGTLLFFTAEEQQTGRELWKSDGTAAGTALVKDVVPGSGSTLFIALANVDGTLYFVTSDGLEQWVLWRSDGTEAGTVRLQYLATRSIPGDPFLTSAFVSSTFFFTPGDTAVGRELWAVPLADLIPVCGGDCNGNGAVTVDELVTGVNIALGNILLTQCAVLDADSNGEVTVNELVVAVSNALGGCR